MTDNKEKHVRDAENDKAVWGAINSLREEQSDMNARVAITEQQHKELAEWRKKNEEQMDALIKSINNAALQFAEAKGAARLGKAIIQFLVATGLGGLLVSWFGIKIPGVGSG